jgi:hypothetical protein
MNDDKIRNLIWDLADKIPEQMGADRADCTDFSEDSIVNIDVELDIWIEDDFPPEEKLQIYVWGIGAYIAAIIDQYFIGTWARDAETGEISFASKSNEVIIYPFNWVIKKLTNGDDIYSKYKMACNLMASDRRI